MVSVEEGGHGVEEVLVPVQVLFLLNQLKFELGANRLILKGVVVLNVVYQLLEKVAGVVRLKQIVVDVLRPVNGLVIISIELVAVWGLDLLLEVEHFNDVGFLALPS